MSLLCVCAQLSLQTGHQLLVCVVRHQTHHLHPPLYLCRTQNVHKFRNQDKQTCVLVCNDIFTFSARTHAHSQVKQKQPRWEPQIKTHMGHEALLLLLKDDGGCPCCLSSSAVLQQAGLMEGLTADKQHINKADGMWFLIRAGTPLCFDIQYAEILSRRTVVVSLQAWGDLIYWLYVRLFF